MFITLHRDDNKIHLECIGIDEAAKILTNLRSKAWSDQGPCGFKAKTYTEKATQANSNLQIKMDRERRTREYDIELKFNKMTDKHVSILFLLSISLFLVRPIRMKL